MSKDMVECKILEAKLVGTDVVTYRLEDGTLMKIRIDLDRIGEMVGQKGQDGTPIYNFSISTKVQIIPQNKRFFAPKPMSQPKPLNESTMKPI